MEYLTLEQVNEILPKECCLDLSVKKIHRVVYTTINKEYLPIATSKVSKLKSSSKILYNTITDFYISIGCKYVCFIVGTKGVILLPIDILKDYNNYSGWKGVTKKGKQYWIRGTIKDGKIFFIPTEGSDKIFDVTSYFIPYNINK